MKKTKGKVNKNKARKKLTLLSGAAESIKNLRKRKFSTTQKVIGGADSSRWV